MKKYKVTFTDTTVFEKIIEANNLEEAREIGTALDGNEFKIIWQGHLDNSFCVEEVVMKKYILETREVLYSTWEFWAESEENASSFEGEFGDKIADDFSDEMEVLKIRKE